VQDSGGNPLGGILEPVGNSFVLSGIMWTPDHVSGAGDGQKGAGVLRGTPLESPVWTKEIVTAANPNDKMYLATQPQYAWIFKMADGREAVIYVGGHNTEEQSPWDTYFVQYYDPSNPVAGWSMREEVWSMWWNPAAAPISGTPEYDFGGASLDETPFHALADPTGGFYFVFTDNNVATALVMHYPPRTFAASGGGGAVIGNVAY